MKLGDWLREKGWSKVEFAKRLKVTRGSIHNWVNRDKVPSEFLFDKIEEITEGVVQKRDFFLKMPFQERQLCPSCRKSFLKESFDEDLI